MWPQLGRRTFIRPAHGLPDVALQNDSVGGRPPGLYSEDEGTKVGVFQPAAIAPPVVKDASQAGRVALCVDSEEIVDVPRQPYFLFSAFPKRSAPRLLKRDWGARPKRAPYLDFGETAARRSFCYVCEEWPSI
jgi:hypothetical protein